MAIRDEWHAGRSGQEGHWRQKLAQRGHASGDAIKAHLAATSMKPQIKHQRRLASKCHQRFVRIEIIRDYFRYEIKHVGKFL